MNSKKQLSPRKIDAMALAEEGKLPKAFEPLSPEEARLMLHELRVHQIELEAQNEELRRTQVELTAAKASYFELYDLAPVGYCTLNKQGLIQQANLHAASLLGMGRGALLRQAFTRFIVKEDQDTYYLFRKKVLDSGVPQTCELQLVKGDGQTRFKAHLAATAGAEGGASPAFRIVLMRCGQE